MNTPPLLDTAAAVEQLQAGHVIAYPTEAVYGLGCDPRNADAVRRILEIKRRPMQKGLILIAAELAQLAPYVEPVDSTRMGEILRTWPGPFTWLLPAKPETPAWLTGDHDTLAVRVTAHPLAAALCRTAGTALVSTSANLSGLAPARTALQVRLQLGGQVDYILAGACGGQTRPSTIRDGRSGAAIRA